MPTKPWWESDPVAPPAQADGDWWTRDALDEAFIKGPVVRATPEPGLFEELGNAVHTGLVRGRNKVRSAIDEFLGDSPVSDDTARGLGYKDAHDYSVAESARLRAQQEREAQAVEGPPSRATVEGQQAMAEADKHGFMPALKAIATHPRAAAVSTAESLGEAAPGMVGSMALGPFMPVGVGANSAVLDYQSTIEQTLSEAGVDLTDAAAVRAALGNPELVAKARQRANDHAIPVTLFDTLTAGIAGRLAAGARGPLSAAGRVGAETGMQAGGGAAGEALGQLNSEGRVSSPSNVIMEAVGEMPTEITEAPIGYRDAVRNAERNQQRVSREKAHADYRDLAEQFGATISSLDRTPEHNREVGGKPNSQHLRGTAGDFVVPEQQKSAFTAEAQRRGYQVIDEGDHLHVQVPRGTNGAAPATNVADNATNVAERARKRAEQVARGELTPGAATVDDALDQERAARGLPLEPSPTPVKTADVVPTKEAAPAAELPGMGVADLLEQHRSALADANDKARTPEQRRAAKKRAQYLMSEIEAQNAKPQTGLAAQIEERKNTLLDAVVQQGMNNLPIQPDNLQMPQQVAPATPPTPAPVPAQAPSVQPAADIHPVAAAPAVAPQAQPEQPLPQAPAEQGVWQAVGEARTPDSEKVRFALNSDPGLLSAAHTAPDARTFAPPRELGENDVVEVQLAPEQRTQLDRLGKLLDRRIIPYDLKTPGRDNLVGLAFDTKHIFINVAAARASNFSLVGLVGHEFTHTLRKQGNAMMESLIGFAKEKINQDNSYVQQQWRAYSSAYSQRGYNKSQMLDVFTEELVADLVGDLISDEQFWAELAQDNPSLFRKTIKRFIDFLRGLADRAKKLGDSEAFHQIEQVRARAATMLRVYMQDAAKRGEAPAQATSVKAKLGEVTPAEEEQASAEAIRQQVREKHDDTMIQHSLENGDYHRAAALATKYTKGRPAPVRADTPELQQFLRNSSRRVNPNADTEAKVYTHGTARDITAFRPKQAESVFMAQNPDFSAPFSAASQAYIDLNEGHHTFDGKPLHELRDAEPVGSVKWMAFDSLIRWKGDVERAVREAATGYYAWEDALGEVHAITMDEADELSGLIAQYGARVQKRAANSSGMNTMPLITNAENPWDFDDKVHVNKLVKALREDFPSAREFGRAVHHSFETWEAVAQTLSSRFANWDLVERHEVLNTLKEMGYDSYFVSENGDKNLAVFDPRKVKSATGNVGAFGQRPPTIEEAASLGMTLEEALAAQNAGDIRLSLGRVLAQTFTNGLLNDDTRAQMERWFLDEYRDVREVQKLIAKNTLGGRVPPNMDAHRNENLRHGAYQDARTRAEERFIKPIARAISKAGATMDEFSDYLWWRHAPERDAYLRSKLDPSVQVPPDGLAGIDPKDAAANIAALDPRKRAAFERAAKFIDGMRRFTLDTLVQSGQITQDHYNNVLAQYQHYVPLRGMPDGSESLNKGGARGLSMNGKALGQRAAGRKTKPQNIIEEMMRDMDNSLVGQQKQRVLDSLVRLIAAHPDPDLWEIQPIAAERKWVNGVLTVVQTNGTPSDQITFMHRGIPVKIEIRHEGMRKAMLNLSEPVPKWLRAIGRVTRWLSAVKTSFSPFFLLVNPVRDAGLAVMGVGAEHGMGALRDMAKFYPHTYKVLALDQRRKIAPSNHPVVRQLQQYAREFAAIGGKTGYTYVADIREQQHKLQHLMDRHANSKGMRDIMAGNFDTKDAALIARKALQHTAHLFEVVNDMAENSTRLAVYAAMREKGLSVEDSAAYAKEVTVNFNRRGSLGKVLNGFYMFFNAAMQGSARLVRLMKNPKFAAMQGSMFAASYALALGQMFSAGDDDDGESLYDKAISDGQAQRSLSVMLGNGKSLAIPVPYGPNIFTYLGYRMAKLTYDQSRGKRPSLGDVAGDIATQVLTSMSPLDPGKGLQAFLPEAARIIANAQTNTNDFGNKISPKLDPFDYTGNPRFPKTDVKTGTPYLWLAQALNTATGGNGYDGGLVNWTGEQARYVVEQMTGGLGRMATESWELAENMLAGVDPEPSDVPLANVYFRGKGAEQGAGTYYDNLNDYENTVADWKLAITNDDQAQIERIIKHAPWIEGAEEDASTKAGREAQAGSVMEAKRSIDRQMKQLRKEKDGILADKTLDWRERKRQAREIDLEIAELQKDFNYEINSGRGFQSIQR